MGSCSFTENLKTVANGESCGLLARAINLPLRVSTDLFLLLPRSRFALCALRSDSPAFPPGIQQRVVRRRPQLTKNVARTLPSGPNLPYAASPVKAAESGMVAVARRRGSLQLDPSGCEGRARRSSSTERRPTAGGDPTFLKFDAELDRSFAAGRKAKKL